MLTVCLQIRYFSPLPFWFQGQELSNACTGSWPLLLLLLFDYGRLKPEALCIFKSTNLTVF